MIDESNPFLAIEILRYAGYFSKAGDVLVGASLLWGILSLIVFAAVPRCYPRSLRWGIITAVIVGGAVLVQAGAGALVACGYIAAASSPPWTDVLYMFYAGMSSTLKDDGIVIPIYAYLPAILGTIVAALWIGRIRHRRWKFQTARSRQTNATEPPSAMT